MFKVIILNYLLSVFSLSAYSNYQILPYGGGESVSKAFKKSPPVDGFYPGNLPRVHLELKHSCVNPNMRNRHAIGPDIANKNILTVITAKSGSKQKSICVTYRLAKANFSVKKLHGGSCVDFSSGDRFLLESTSSSTSRDSVSPGKGYYNNNLDRSYFNLSFVYPDFEELLDNANSRLTVGTYYSKTPVINGRFPPFNSSSIETIPVSVTPSISRLENPVATLDLHTAVANFKCGSFTSPLMLFFSDKRPSFLNISNFPLFRNKKTAWVEKDHVGYFLAIDLDKDGKISEKDELFGNDLKYLNGFESLKRFDSNRDGLISHKDERFKDLLLWNDKNGDGLGLKRELSPLHKKVKEISLNYTGENTVQTENALASGRSHFITKKGKKAEIIDYWFKPAK